jgi:hypothetical protein
MTTTIRSEQKRDTYALTGSSRAAHEHRHAADATKQAARSPIARGLSPWRRPRQHQKKIPTASQSGAKSPGLFFRSNNCQYVKAAPAEPNGTAATMRPVVGTDRLGHGIVSCCFRMFDFSRRCGCCGLGGLCGQVGWKRRRFGQVLAYSWMRLCWATCSAPC